MELGVGRQDPRLLPQARRQPADELVGVGRDRDGSAAGKLQMFGERCLHPRDHVAEHHVPLVAREPCRVAPALLLCCERHVGPVVMAVAGEVDAFRRA